MSDAPNRIVAERYDELAELYAELAADELDRVATDREALEVFARRIPAGATVVDIGCGPGHVTAHLASLGVAAIGIDLSPAMVAIANRDRPTLDVREGDGGATGLAAGSAGGIVARYSIIHADEDQLGVFFAEWARILVDGGLALVSFFAADDPRDHGRPFDHRVVEARQWHPDRLADLLCDHGFSESHRWGRSPLEGERPMNHASLLMVSSARRRVGG